ncbi:ribosomal protection-like ABC-F family protein [Desmospora activa]|uniref:ATPase subunit of ABC transporter with duplicated ATPase domains n=1 Tax=Desmospora activa DSM 45169 TaxID=1121389 RepID=A0A2T4Z7E9_9BACL|nr:ABC-F type ribosomal protection protein [Desmospora activa]PTM57821.1 ATPase subunit of ABC transporter with duplicated ATPase domains [Desmospora activa DSM 45169]
MLLVKAEGLKVERGSRLLFENVDIEIHAGEKVALIGANGMGKTSLLQTLTGEVNPESGSVFRAVPVQSWGVLSQHQPWPPDVTVEAYVRSGRPELAQLYQELTKVEQEMANATGEALDPLVAHYGVCQELYQQMDGYEWEVEVQRTLNQLGLTGEIATASIAQLSGGQKTRTQLAQLVVKQPTFLLLDEPTNHLDASTLEWLARWLSDWEGAVLFVSHDRWFIDQVADVTVELSKSGTRAIRGGYSRFAQQQEHERKSQEALWRKQEQEKKKLEESIRRYREWFNRAHTAAGERNPFMKKKAQKNITRSQAKEEALKRLEKKQVERPRDEPVVQVRLDTASMEGRRLLTVEDGTFAYGKQPLLQEVNLQVQRGDRLALIGANGSGKTTLLKLLAHRLQPQQGTVRHHPELRIGYFAQELETLDPNETIVDSLLRLPGMTQTEARNILASFLFRKERVFQRIGSLSMGERCRVAFVRLYFSHANLLILDEPTNYLDIPTRERMEEALAHYPGSIIVVSHDRFLLSRIANRVAVLEQGRLTLFEDGYQAYREQKSEKKAMTNPHQDQIHRLKLRLIQLMGMEEPEEEEKRKQLWSEIQKTRRELDGLQKESVD